MKENNKVKTHTVEHKKNPCHEHTKVPCLPPRPITLDLCTVRRAINKVAGTLCDPKYENKMTEYTQASVNYSLETLQELTQLSCRLSCLDRRGWDCLINCSIDELMNKYLEFNSDLIDLLKKNSKETIDILKSNLDKCQEEEEEEKA